MLAELIPSRNDDNGTVIACNAVSERSIKRILITEQNRNSSRISSGADKQRDLVNVIT